MQAIEQWVSPSSIPQGLQISFMKVIVLFPGHSSPLIFVQAAEGYSVGATVRYLIFSQYYYTLSVNYFFL